jgi:hypothetical protein
MPPSSTVECLGTVPQCSEYAVGPCRDTRFLHGFSTTANFQAEQRIIRFPGGDVNSTPAFLPRFSGKFRRATVMNRAAGDLA